MEEFYAEMEKRYQTSLEEEEKKNIDRWKTCVEESVVRSIALREVRCKFPTPPQRSTLDKLETPNLKLMTQLVPDRYTAPPFYGERAHYVVREAVRCWADFNCKDHSKSS